VIKVDYWPNNMTLLLYMQQARRERERETSFPSHFTCGKGIPRFCSHTETPPRAENDRRITAEDTLVKRARIERVIFCRRARAALFHFPFERQGPMEMKLMKPLVLAHGHKRTSERAECVRYPASPAGKNNIYHF
jgi:hypothetical protein